MIKKIKENPKITTWLSIVLTAAIYTVCKIFDLGCDNLF